MNQELYRPFGEKFSAKAEDFQASESYRWVRLGIWLLMIGYVLLLPLIAGTAFTLSKLRGLKPLIDDPNYHGAIIAIALATVAAMTMTVVGCVLLRFSPEEDERAAANKYLIAYGIAFALSALAFFSGVDQLKLVRRIATAYGSFYVLAYFQVLAANRDNWRLIWWSNFTNSFFVVLIFGSIGAGVLMQMQVIPTIVSFALIGGGLAVMYFAWMKTLWHALEATRPVAKDFEPKQEDLR